MDGQQLVGAPLELNTPRVVLHAPRQEFAALFVHSLNLSLPGLRYIAFAQQERTLDWGADFIARDLLWWAQGEGLVYYAFERATGAYVGRVDLHSWDFATPRCEVGYVGDVRTAGPRPDARSGAGLRGPGVSNWARCGCRRSANRATSGRCTLPSMRWGSCAKGNCATMSGMRRGGWAVRCCLRRTARAVSIQVECARR
jgi:hypothetical protein